MSELMQMTESIEVDADPATAFAIFTDEFDQWWGRGPIDAYDSWRLIERRIEGGLGGRLVEDYGEEQRVLGTIITWEPGACLAWTTGNGVVIEVRFEPSGSGTLVCVTGSVPPGADGIADLSMVRMVPQWLPRYVARRARGEVPPDYGRLHLVLRSATPSATARWLVDVFQLEQTADIPDEEGDPEHTWIELRIGASFVALWGGGGSPGTDSPFVYVDDLDAHLEHARRAGATIVSPITEHGFRSYTRPTAKVGTGCSPSPARASAAEFRQRSSLPPLNFTQMSAEFCQHPLVGGAGGNRTPVR